MIKGAIVSLQLGEGELKEKQEQRLREFGEEIALQVMAMKPKYLNEEDVPEDGSFHSMLFFSLLAPETEDVDEDYEPVLMKQESIVQVA